MIMGAVLPIHGHFIARLDVSETLAEKLPFLVPCTWTKAAEQTPRGPHRCIPTHRSFRFPSVAITSPISFRYLCPHSGASLTADAFFAGRMIVCPCCKRAIVLESEPDTKALQLLPRIVTPRLLLETATKADVDSLLPLVSDPANFEYEVIEPANRRRLKREIGLSLYPKRFEKSKRIQFIARRDEEVIGTCTLQIQSDLLQAEVGILIHHPHAGQGFGTEVVGHLTDFALRGLRLHRVFAALDAENAACLAVFEKVGFRQEAHFEKWHRHPGRGWIDGLVFAKLREEWVQEAAEAEANAEQETS